ncbi:endolytic transglycosylase MltG [Actinacidiphila acididurans]|uniref:Endolytic murein transglycosylase n=1 Tax=Actinacidiphila acididurans TaxID=2784346 RepID=A0ABS2U2D2_9ACTN|nr:endolytic transglycosylase MltG [Actinacidiphila acididurans]MBM9509759.1 endolytic transglycosylase MltG [Actinacidiphila acididurans]
MTDYGRGTGSEPWHPEDPLFGDVYDQGQGYHQQQPNHPQQQAGWQEDPYAGQQPHYPQQGYPQQGQQQYPQAQYPQQHPQQAPYPEAPQQHPQPGYEGYDTGGHQIPGYGHQDPYGGQQPQDPYSTGSHDFYGQGGYPPPQQPQYRQPQPGMQQPGMPQQGMQQAGLHQGVPQGGPGMGPGQGQGRPMGPGQGPAGRPQEPAAEPLRDSPGGTGSWQPEEEESDPREHAFFAGRDEDDDDSSSDAGRRTGGGKPKKRRSGCACLGVAVILAGGLGGAAYFGYNFYESHFGPAPDYSGQGSGDVQVQVPAGSSLTNMGNILKNADVVKSVEAFTSAANKNPKGRTIQAGVFLLHKEMSAADAVAMMLDPKSQNAMIVTEGMRDAQVYTLIDQRLGLASGTTRKTALAQVKQLGLPSWADTSSHVKDPLEGFLFPSRYSVAKGMKPEALLREMVGEANKQFDQFDMAAEAKKQGLNSPLQLLTVASLVQAEGKTTDDFRKMAKVVYNRMNPNNPETYGLLQFDSTYNYIKNQNATNINLTKMKALDDRYNTYHYKGLPPGPIGNPGLEALKAAMNPDGGQWYYFISLDGKTTQFTTNLTDFNKLKAQYKPQ